jgi:hypothetical protein
MPTRRRLMQGGYIKLIRKQVHDIVVQIFFSTTFFPDNYTDDF